jgi:hypothetical protein
MSPEKALRKTGLATLLFDLLTTGEAHDRRNVLDIKLLTQRLLIAAAWVPSPRPRRRLVGRRGSVRPWHPRRGGARLHTVSIAVELERPDAYGSASALWLCCSRLHFWCPLQSRFGAGISKRRKASSSPWS